MEKRDTKREILYRALELFSVRGYQGVSVKDIAGAVGIKDSSLYKHYRSKQEIFDSLLEEMNRHFGETVALYAVPQGEGAQAAQRYMEKDLAYLKGVCRWNFLFFWKDPYAAAYRRLLCIERYRNTQAAEILREYFLEIPLRFQRNLLAEMVAAGFLRPADPAVMALEFYAPFWYLLDRYEGQPEREAEALERLDAHVEQFWNVYRTERSTER